MNATCAEFLKTLAALVVATVASGRMAAAAELNAPERPNILMIFVDDMGCRGDQYEFHSRLGPIQSATTARGKLR